MNFDITIQENQLSLTNRAKHLSKCNDVDDLLKHLFTVRYHAEFGRSRSNNVRISREELAQNWHPLGLRRLGMQGAADHLKTSPSLKCYHAHFGRSSLESVVIDRKIPKFGSAAASPAWAR